MSIKDKTREALQAELAKFLSKGGEVKKASITDTGLTPEVFRRTERPLNKQISDYARDALGPLHSGIEHRLGFGENWAGQKGFRTGARLRRSIYKKQG